MANSARSSDKAFVSGRSRPAINHRAMAERRMDIGFAATEAEALVKAACHGIINGGAKPDSCRHLSLGEVEQSSTHPLPLAARCDENLIEPADFQLQGEKACQPAIVVVSQIDRPSRRQLLRYAGPHCGLGRLPRSGETGRAPALEPETRSLVEVGGLIGPY
jgi:hypothetical protein